MSEHPDLGIEQAYLDRAYEHLAAMRARTEAAVAIEESAARPSTRRSRKLTCGTGCAVSMWIFPGSSFGRLDDENGDTWYVGRRHVEDERGDPVVVDWRGAVSTPFYRATAADPIGLTGAAGS